MNDLENYKNIVENIFGLGTFTFSITGNYSNPVIGSLNDPLFCKDFINNFIKRLQRLNDIYKRKSKNRKSLIDQINQIATVKWQGAYSELVGFDFLCNLNARNFYRVILDKDINYKRTFTKELGKTSKANLDGYFEGHQVYFDIKCFKDNIKEILEDEIKKLPNNNLFTVTPEYPIYENYKIYSDNKVNIFNELSSKIDITEKTPSFRSSVITDLSYKIRWGEGVTITESSYNPYQHAEKFSDMTLGYINKFVKDKPFFLVFVIFPWFNGIISSFQNSNKIFYRALARRTFLQHKNNRKKLQEINPKFNSNKTIYKVSKKLSGILFLEDNSIMSETPDEHNVKGYFYINPNADNKIGRGLFYDYLLSLGCLELDGFEYDNY